MLRHLILFGLSIASIANEEDHPIMRWRNKNAGGNLKVYKSSDVGMGTRDKATKVEVPRLQLVHCIKEKRDDDDNLEKTGYLNVDKALVYFGECICTEMYKDQKKICKATVDYTRKELALRHFSKYHLTKEYGSAVFFDEINFPEKTENVFVKTITNRGTADVVSTLSSTFLAKEGNSTTLTSEIGGSLGVEIEINGPVFSFKSTTEVSGSSKFDEIKTQVDTTSLTIKKAFTVGAKSAIQIIGSVKVRQYEMKYKMPVAIGGAVAVEVDRGQFILVPTASAAAYFEGFSKTNDKNPRLQAYVIGTVKGVTHYDAHAHQHDIPINSTFVKKNICHPLPTKL